MQFFMVMSHSLLKQIKSSLKQFTRTYRIAKDFEHLPGKTVVSSNQNKTDLVFDEVSIYLRTK